MYQPQKKAMCCPPNNLFDELNELLDMPHINPCSTLPYSHPPSNFPYYIKAKTVIIATEFNIHIAKPNNMKNKIFFVSLLSVVLFSCSSTQLVFLSVQQPAPVTIPSYIKNVGVVNRSTASDQTKAIRSKSVV